MENIVFVTKTAPESQEIEKRLKQAFTQAAIKTPAKLVIATGGDGTLLQAIKDHYEEDVLFIGVSAGTLGLLETIEVEDIDKLVTAISSGTYSLIEAPLIAASFCQPAGGSAREDTQEGVIGHGFNDISVERAGPRAAKLHLKIDSSSGTFIGDGVIFSTPLGSTAYSLAAGGPVIDSKLQDLFVVTPNNPHFSSQYSSLQRPHIIERQRMVRVEVTDKDARERPLQLVIDGHIAVENLDKPVNIYLSNKSIKLMQLNDHDLQNRLDAKRLGRL